MSAQHSSAGPTGPPPAGRRRGLRSRRAIAVAAVAVGGTGLLGLSLAGVFASGAGAAVATNCQVTPSSCGFPDATNTGVPAGTVLKTVPGQVSSGPGWAYNAGTQTVNVTGNGAVLSGLSIAADVNVTASNVTISNDKIAIGGIFGISLRHTANVTIANSAVGGANATTGRVSYAIDDIYGDSTGMVFKNNDITNWRIGINTTSGQVTGNYIHDAGFIAGDHTDGIYDAPGTAQLSISGNTVFNNVGQACAIMLQSIAGQPTGNKSIAGNLLAGGSYAVYAGGALGNSSNITFTGNRFTQQYFPKSGRYGALAQFQSGSGNAWNGNIWDTTGASVTP